MSRRSPARNPPSLVWVEDEGKVALGAGYRGFRGGVGDEILEVGEAAAEAGATDERWSRMLPELLVEIVRRVESSDDGRWPARKSVVSCACVCRRWREVIAGVIGPPKETGKITFPWSLKQPGPRDLPIQCFIRRNKKNSSYYLYLSLTETLLDKGKFLLAAQRFRHGISTEYIISLDADNLSQRSKAYVGKVRSGFLGTKFTIFDSSPACNGAKSSSGRGSRRFASKQISPQVPIGNFKIGRVSYKLSLLKSREPRRMLCTLHCSEGITAQEEQKMSVMGKPGISIQSLIMRNKAPRWHDNLQCWCLNFHGRVTIASVKNFQLIAASDPYPSGGINYDETVLLQFGKVGDDMFTMDYREPLSAFQAFAICLTSFGAKLGCE